MKSDGTMNKLSDELLEQIAGGLSGGEVILINATIASMKKEGYSLEAALETFSTIKDPRLRQETLDYVAANWDRS